MRMISTTSNDKYDKVKALTVALSVVVGKAGEAGIDVTRGDSSHQRARVAVVGTGCEVGGSEDGRCNNGVCGESGWVEWVGGA